MIKSPNGNLRLFVVLSLTSPQKMTDKKTIHFFHH